MGAVMAALSVEARRRFSRPSCLPHCGHGAAGTIAQRKEEAEQRGRESLRSAKVMERQRRWREEEKEEEEEEEEGDAKPRGAKANQMDRRRKRRSAVDISVDIRAAFIQLTGLVLMLRPGPGNKPMPPSTNQTESRPVLPPYPAVMGIQGMELFAIGVVIILFMAVLKQFGILEPMSSFEVLPIEPPSLLLLLLLFHPVLQGLHPGLALLRINYTCTIEQAFTKAA
ncbi:unnamed protein product [Pleuronectes platessa]|uniref:Uncharacterized protein n=1 Tax=Pleuronectes platessa TaxID=8262 RepID=A0A9N7V5Y0_PLEPL|nr:unnamed protein product [Pleuronectes platessa]